MIFFGSNITAIVFGCDGVASGRVSYQKGHPFNLPMIVKVFFVLCWDQSATLNILRNVVTFLFIGKSKQDNNLWNVYTIAKLLNPDCKVFFFYYLKTIFIELLLGSPLKKRQFFFGFLLKGGGKVKFVSKSFQGLFHLEFGHFQGNLKNYFF